MFLINVEKLVWITRWMVLVSIIINEKIQNYIYKAYIKILSIIVAKPIDIQALKELLT